MLTKRWIILLAVPMLLLSFAGCKKSEGTKIQNFFGASPALSELSITKERKDFSCTATEPEDLCAEACLKTIKQENASIDLVTASAKVIDPTLPSNGDILVVVLRFLDPPPPASQVQQFSLEMFDSGPVTLGTRTLSSGLVLQIVSGDLVAGDGVYTRKFYFGTSTSTGAGTCVEETDMGTMSHTYSTYGTSLTIDPSNKVNFTFNVQAIDKSGNIDTSSDTVLPIQGTFRETVSTRLPCGPPCPF